MSRQSQTKQMQIKVKRLSRIISSKEKQNQIAQHWGIFSEIVIRGTVRSVGQ